MYNRMNQNPNPNNNRRSNYFMNDDFGFNNDPRKESFCDFIRYFFCPRFKLVSITSFLLFANTIMFIVLISQGIEDSKLSNLSFLAVNKKILPDFGALIYNQAKSGQIYRFISYLFLHADLSHLMFNCISLIIIGSNLEALVGALKFSIIYFLSGIAGGLFYLLIDKTGQTVGASGAIYGLLGAYISFHFINWNFISELIGPSRAMINVIFLILVVLLGFSLQFSNQLINSYAHIGGFLTGFLLLPVVLKTIQENDGALCTYKIWFYVSFALLFIFFIGGFLLFYLA